MGRAVKNEVAFRSWLGHNTYRVQERSARSGAPYIRISAWRQPRLGERVLDPEGGGWRKICRCGAIIRIGLNWPITSQISFKNSIQKEQKTSVSYADTYSLNRYISKCKLSSALPKTINAGPTREVAISRRDAFVSILRADGEPDETLSAN